MSAEKNVKVTVSFDGGAVWFDAPFFASDESLIRMAREALPGFLQNFTNPKVERVSQP